MKFFAHLIAAFIAGSMRRKKVRTWINLIPTRRLKKRLGAHVRGLLVQSENGLFVVDSDDVSIGMDLRRHGQYGLDQLIILRQKIASDDNILVVGAHIGALAIPMSQYCANVVAIEANPMTYELLEMNIVLNRRDNIQSKQIAASDKEETLNFLLRKYRTGGSMRIPRAEIFDFHEDNPQQISVKAASLDAYLGDTSFDIILMDIEGSEYFALKGMQNILAQCRLLEIEFIPRLLGVAGVSVAQFVAVIAPHFNRLTIPSLGITVQQADFLPQLQAMSDKRQGDAGIIFEKSVSGLPNRKITNK